MHLFKIDYSFDGKRFKWYMTEPTEEASRELFKRRTVDSVVILSVKKVRLNKQQQASNSYRIG